MAATHRDLEGETEKGRFGEDLFYRLNVFRIGLPPLRERRSDIPLLVEEALDRLRKRSQHAVPDSCSPLAMRLLRSYRWPGNVRELFSVIESAAIRAESDRIEAYHLPDDLRRPAEREGADADSTEPTSGSGPPGGDGRYRAPEEEDEEREAIRAALEEAGGVRGDAADLLGMSRTTLWRKMKEYGLE